jgi:serine/threonine-protein kinase
MTLPQKLGRYTLHEQIGQGGTAEIYRATAPNEPLSVALKLARTDGTPDEQADWIGQLRQEASMLSWFNGTSIPKCYEYFESGGRHCLALELIEGQNLDTILAEMTAPLPEHEAIQWGLTICEVLLRLHNHQPQPYIYRFVAPDNLMRDRQGQIYVMDYGKVTPYDVQRTYPLLGLIGYSAPEQYVGKPEPRSDVYGLGVLLYHAVTLRDPRTPTEAFLFQVIPPRSRNPALSEAFEAVILKAVEHKAIDRYPTVDAMKAALLACL